MQLVSVAAVRRALLLSSYRITSKRSRLRERIKSIWVSECGGHEVDDSDEQAYGHKIADTDERQGHNSRPCVLCRFILRQNDNCESAGVERLGADRARVCCQSGTSQRMNLNDLFRKTCQCLYSQGMDYAARRTEAATMPKRLGRSQLLRFPVLLNRHPLWRRTMRTERSDRLCST